MSPNFLSRFDKERLGQRKAAVGEAAAAGRALGSLVVDSSFELGLFAKLPVGPVCCRVSSSEEQTAAFVAEVPVPLCLFGQISSGMGLLTKKWNE